MAKILDQSNKNKQLIINKPDIEDIWICSTKNVMLKYN